MSIFNRSTPFDADVEKVTNEMNTVEDWSLILDICEKVSRQPNGSKDCLKSIVKRLNHKVPFVSMQALTLLDACVNNCGRPFHLEICSRDFVSECRTLISQKAHPKVAQRLGLMIKQWGDMKEFKDDPALNLIPSFYDSLKKEGFEFVDTDAKPASSAATSHAKKEEDDLMKAIALSLQESDNKTSGKGSGSNSGGAGGGGSGLYPTYNTGPASQTYSKPVQKEIRKVRALYDFEAAEDNELTFKAGELICVLDDSDPNWWKGSNHRGEGLFPANFVTSDLSVEPEPEVKAEKKSVQFSDEVEVKTMAVAPGEEEIDEGKIDEVLALIQNADPTGETRPDNERMLVLEEQCKGMGPLIDAELEKIDRKHANLVELNQSVMEALQMYHSLMKETPAYGYTALKAQGPPHPAMFSPPGVPPNTAMGPPPQVYGGQAQYMGAGAIRQAQPSMAGMGGNPVQTYTQNPATAAPSGHQSFQGQTTVPPMSNYSSLPQMGGQVPNMQHPVLNGSAPLGPPSQQYNNSSAYAQAPPQANLGMYHHHHHQSPPPPQQPLL